MEKLHLQNILHNQLNEILIEITFSYKWHLTDLRTVRRKKEYISYEEFIKNYQPIDVIKIDKETALEWLKQTEELMQIMTKNYEEYEKKSNKLNIN